MAAMLMISFFSNPVRIIFSPQFLSIPQKTPAASKCGARAHHLESRYYSKGLSVLADRMASVNH